MRFFFPLYGLALCACASIRSSAVAIGNRYPSSERPVSISATQIPEGAEQVGLVEARGAAGIDALIPELIRRTREVGGNYAVIDHVLTRFESYQTIETYQYPCSGPMRPNMYCTGSRPISGEMMVTRIVARAFRVASP